MLSNRITHQVLPPGRGFEFPGHYLHTLRSGIEMRNPPSIRQGGQDPLPMSVECRTSLVAEIN
jgi:hypothetical protein